MRAATTTFHRARYQHAITATTTTTITTAASTRTRDLAPLASAAATATTTSTANTPTPSVHSDTAHRQTERQQQEQQQQTSNKTWPPGTSFGSGCSSRANNINNARTATTGDRVADSCTHRISEPINLFSASLSSLSPPAQPLLDQLTIANLRHSNVLLVRAAYKGVEYLHSRRQSKICEVQDTDRQEQQQQQLEEADQNLRSTPQTNETFPPENQAQLALGLPPPAANQQQQHEYQELGSQDELRLIRAKLESAIRSRQEDLTSEAQQFNLQAGRQKRNSDQNKLNSSSNNNNNNQQQQTKTAGTNKRATKPKQLAMATLRPISPQYQHTLDSAISLSKELASKNMADSGESSPKTPNSPDKKRFNFKLKHFSKSYSEASASIRDIESSISDEAKLAYKSLVERGQFNSYHHHQQHQQPFGGGRSFNYRQSPNARDYANEDFLTPTTPPATTSKFKYSTFSVKKSFF